MKKTLIFLLCICVFIGTCSFSTSAATNTYDITELEGKYKTQGRTEVVDGALFLDWSASGMEFNANCSGDVSIKVNTTRIRSGETGGIYFTVIVDGVVQYENQRIPSNNNTNSWTSNSTNYPFKIQNEGISEFTIAKDLEPGSHTFEIYNQTEAMHASFGISSITLDGEITDLPEDKKLYIEFVGDSITAGLGNIAKGSSSAEVPLYQDATRGWAYLTAKNVNADWSLIAQSGITASNGIGWEGASSVSMQTVYPKLRYYSDNNKNYNFNRSADVVVICLGTNDLWTYQNQGKDLDYLQNGFEEILELIRTKNPNSKIVWIYGMMTSNADAVIKQAIQNKGGENKGFYSLELPKDTSGGQGHPGLEIQKTYSEIVSSYISKVLKDECVTNHSYIEKISANYLKTPATCISKAIYYKSCSVCGIKGSETFEYGEVDPSNHKHTEVRDAKSATCCEAGYTGDTWCTDCNTKIASGKAIPATGNHVDVDGKWESDGTNHWHTCYFGTKFDVTAHSGGEATCVAKAVCTVCGVQYGELDPDNHTHIEVRDTKAATEQEKGYTGDTWCLDCNKKVAEGKDIEMLEHKPVLVKAEDATAAKEGNIKHYYCENCGKYYSDEAGTKEITKEDTVVAKLAPKIIDGNNVKFDKSSKEPVSFRSDAAFVDFIRVELDGKELVKDKDYTLKEGSIIATLTPEFAATLSAGEHTLGIVSASGTAVANFTVTDDNASSDNSTDNTEKSPQTGENSKIVFWCVISVISLAAICTTGLNLKKKKQSR